MLLLPLLSAALAVGSVTARQQIPLRAPTNNPATLAQLVSPTLNRPTLARLESTLAALSDEHLDQLEAYVGRYPQKRIVKLAEDGPALEITEGGKALLSLEGIRFIDVTDHSDVLSVTVKQQNEYPTTLAHNASQLAPLFKSISIPEMQTFLGNFTNFFNRHYRSQYGRESQLFLLEHLKDLHASLNPHANISFTEFTHEWSGQKSIVVHWPATRSKSSGDSDGKGSVILSAHQDSTNRLPFLRAPGADDDGSGTTALIQAFKGLLESGWAPTTHPLELMFFSAEEGGLLGSGDVAASYQKAGQKVRALFHMDVVAYVKPNTKPVIGLITDPDGVDPSLTDFMELLVDEYAEIPAARTRCGYSCSDHSSWTRKGYPSACLAEGNFEDSNPNMHSTGDTTTAAGYSFEHIAQYSRVAIGYAVELAGFKPVKKKQ
ncbi:hypothetical protein JCM10207_000866 [Rhodosporidiobolus poonsookiae]